MEDKEIEARLVKTFAAKASLTEANCIQLARWAVEALKEPASGAAKPAAPAAPAATAAAPLAGATTQPPPSPPVTPTAGQART